LAENETQGKWALPDGWALVGFDEAVTVVSTTGKKVKQRDYLPSGALPVIDQGQEFIGGHTNDAEKQVECELPVIVFGDHTKAFKFVDFSFVAGADGVKVIKPVEAFYPKLLFYFLQALDLPDRGYSRHFQFLRKETLPLPPFPEQRRIVAEIETQFTRLDAGGAALERAQANLRRYKASVLKAACEGRLVHTEASLACAEGRDYEPAGQLLSRILTERRARWEAMQWEREIEKAKQKAAKSARKAAAGRPLKRGERLAPEKWQALSENVYSKYLPKDDRWRRKYNEPTPPDIADVEDLLDLPKLPEGWVWVCLHQLTWSVKDGPHYSPQYVDEGIPFITGGSVRPDGVDFSSAKHITPELHAELSKRCKPEKGDILYTKGGTTGIARVNTYDQEFSVWVHVAVLKLAGHIDPFYVQHALNSPSCYAQAQKYTHGVGNQDLGLTRMIRIILALPPLAEQHRIVAEVDRRLSVVAALGASVEAALARARRLRQAVLKQAFEGRLVEQDPEDESASMLLEGIRAEKDQREGEGKDSRRGSRKKKQPKQLELL
jgi:restriction endonuclease S subunit